VGVHVESQIVDLVEGLVADCAFVLLLAAVGQLVVLVVPYRRPKTKSRGMEWKEGARASRGRLRCPCKEGDAWLGGHDLSE
jgi:hypothetical protein